MKKYIVPAALLLFAVGGVSAIASGQTAADAVSLGMIAAALAGAALLFLRIRKQRPAGSKQPQTVPAYSFLEFRVAGVSYESDGVSRQAVLRKIKNHTKPFDDEADIALKHTTYEGAPAIAVYVNDFHLGYVPKDSIADVTAAMAQPGALVHSFEVTGGGLRDGERLHLGALVTLRYPNK